MVGGKLVKGGRFEETGVNELFEETDLIAKESDLIFNNICNSVSSDKLHFIQICFVVSAYKGIPKNMEPERCEILEFFSPENLPPNLFYATEGNLKNYINNANYTKASNYHYLSGKGKSI